MWADPLPTTQFAWIQKASLVWAGHRDASVFVCCIFLVIHNLFRTNPVQSQNKDSMFSHSSYRPFPRAITQDYKNAYNAFKKEGKTAASLFGKQELWFCWDLLKRNIIRFCFVPSSRNLCISINYWICQSKKVHHCTLSLPCVPQNNLLVLGSLMIHKIIRSTRRSCQSYEAQARKTVQKALSVERRDIWMFTAVERLNSKLQNRRPQDRGYTNKN